MADVAAGEPSNPVAEDLSAVVRAAWLYYEDGLTQAEIAKRLFVSRQTVSRLLETARQRGVVRIEFDTRYLGSHRLATQLTERFDLEDAIVVPNDKERFGTDERLASAGAAYIRRFLHPNTVIGIGWGQTVSRTLAMIPTDSLTGVRFVSTSGGIASATDALTANAAIASHLELLPAPVLVSTPELARQLNNEPYVKEALDRAAHADVTLTSVGSADPASASAVRNAVLTRAEAAEFQAKGGVGDMFGEWFDARGQKLDGATSDRRIGLSLDVIRRLPHVVCVAGGPHKLDAIRGAMAGRLIKILVTDEQTAGLLAT